MKVSHLSFITLLMLIFAGCSADELIDNTASDGEKTVAFDISLADSPVTSRASDIDNAIWSPTYQGDAGVDIVYIQAYDSDNNPLFVNPKTFDLVNGKATVQLSLPNSSTYTVIFWAQNSKSKVYDLSNLPNVKVNYPKGQINNDPTLTAFCATVNDIHPTLLGSLTVTLRRAVAQINVGMPYDAYEALEANKRPKFSSVTFTGLPDAFNLITQTTSVSDANAKTTFALSQDITAEKGTKLQITDNKTNSQNSYAWLSMSYVFAPSDVHVVTDASFTFQNIDKATDTQSVFTQTLDVKNVPVTRNYRTNILAGLADDVTFNIVTDYSWVSENTAIHYLSSENFEQLSHTGGVADFGNDDVIIDLEGKTVNAPVTTDGVTPVQIICRNLLVKNGTINSGSFWINTTGETHLTDLVFKGKAGKIAARIVIGYTTGELADVRDYSPNITIKNVDFTGVTEASSNCIFIDGAQVASTTTSGVGTEQIFITDSKFANSTDDCVRIIGVGNDAKVIISECSFVVPFRPSSIVNPTPNAVKFSNIGGATNVDINVANCYNLYQQDNATDFYSTNAAYGAGLIGLTPNYAFGTYSSLSTWTLKFTKVYYGNSTSTDIINSQQFGIKSLIGIEDGLSRTMYPESFYMNDSKLTFDTSEYPEGYFKN